MSHIEMIAVVGKVNNAPDKAEMGIHVMAYQFAARTVSPSKYGL